MKSAWFLLLTAVVSWTWIGEASAEGRKGRAPGAKSQEEKADSSSEGTRHAKRAKKKRPLFGTGSLLKVEGDKITVRLRNKGTFTLGTDSGTLVMKGPEYQKFADLKAGQRIRVIYEDREGGMVATEIHLLPEKLPVKAKERGKKQDDAGEPGGPESRQP
jgi:hypothetical protein